MNYNEKDFPGTFITDISTLANKLHKIKAFVFDWDGVFNNGEKSADAGSNFSEVDSMGTNLLRYSYFLNTKKHPLAIVISGEKNNTAFHFCKREGFQYSFFKVAHKINALDFICEKENIKRDEVAFFFDDVLDLSIAEQCGIRILVNQKANPLFANYCVKNKMVDYITGYSGGSHAVREGCEMLMALNGNYDQAITDRKNIAADYKTYIEQRRQLQTEYYTITNEKLERTEI